MTSSSAESRRFPFHHVKAGLHSLTVAADLSARNFSRTISSKRSAVFSLPIALFEAMVCDQVEKSTKKR